MNLSTQPVKGARDFYPDEMRLQNYIYWVWRTACESFGYEEYDAPILESTELYLNKGNQEIINDQTYTFKDRGGRSLTVRTEMTPSVARMVAGKRQELGYPLRLYSIPQCWRYERMQRGRGREFYQLNADIFGVDDLSGDIEVIKLADTIMQRFNAKRGTYSIKVNSRKLVDHLLLEVLNFSEELATDMRGLIDRKQKMTPSAFTTELDILLDYNNQKNEEVEKHLNDFLNATRLDDLKSELANHDSAELLRQLLVSLNKSGITNVKFDPTLMRGFDYYTDIAFEVFDNDPENNRSLFGGGRYEGLVGMFGVENVSAVGFGMGDITLKNFLETHSLLPSLAPATHLYACGMAEGAEQVVEKLRKMNINVAFDDTGRNIGKQIKTAEKLEIRHFIVIGEEEIKTGIYNLKDIFKSQEQRVAEEDLPDFVINPK